MATTARVAVVVQQLLRLQGFHDSAVKGLDEEEIARHLLACDGDIDAAAHRLARRLRSSDEEEVGRSPSPDMAVIQAALPLFARGFDSSGNHVVWLLMDRLNVSLLSELDQRAVATWVGSQLVALLSSKGKVCLVVDCSHSSLFPLSPNDVAIARVWMQTLMEKHPERLASALVVNAPFAFTTASWPLLSRRLGSRTSSKVRVLSSCSELLAFIHERDVPGEFGGKGRSLDSTSFLWKVNEAVREESNHDEIKALARALCAAMERADVVERETLAATAQLRLSVSRPEPSRSGEEQELRAELERVLDEKDSYARAVRFARNYMELGQSRKSESLMRIEAELVRVKRENTLLRDQLEVTFGSSGGSLGQ